MLSVNLFEKGENNIQDYYFFKNEVTSELVQTIKNKSESHWFGMYMNDREDRMFLIPVQTSEDESLMLERVCNWYNDGKKERDYQEAPEANPDRISPVLLNMKNMFGEFPLSSAKRIQAYIDEPTIERWDDISGIIVNGWDSLWHLICEEDASFPKSGRTTDITGKVVAEWTKIPTPFEVLRVIKKATQALKEKDKVRC